MWNLKLGVEQPIYGRIELSRQIPAWLLHHACDVSLCKAAWNRKFNKIFNILWLPYHPVTDQGQMWRARADCAKNLIRIRSSKNPNLTTFSVLVQDSLRVTTGQETGWPNPKVAPRFWTTLVGQTAIDDAYNVQVIAQLKSDHLFLFIFARRHKPDWHVTSQLLRLEIISSKERYTSYTYIKVINILLLNTY